MSLRGGEASLVLLPFPLWEGDTGDGRNPDYNVDIYVQNRLKGHIYIGQEWLGGVDGDRSVFAGVNIKNSALPVKKESPGYWPGLSYQAIGLLLVRTRVLFWS